MSLIIIDHSRAVAQKWIADVGLRSFLLYLHHCHV